MDSVSDNLENIAKILAVSVMIDGHIRDAELVEFSHSVVSINQKIRPEFILPRETVLKWFHTHKSEISERMQSDDSYKWKSELLTKIDDAEFRKMVLAAMFSISVCDYHLDDAECEFLKLATATWKTNVPGAAELDQMVG